MYTVTKNKKDFGKRRTKKKKGGGSHDTLSVLFILSVLYSGCFTEQVEPFLSHDFPRSFFLFYSANWSPLDMSLVCTSQGPLSVKNEFLHLHRHYLSQKMEVWHFL